MTKQQLNGFVIHRRPYRETSLLVDFFSQELGKVTAVAKGVRQAKSDKKSSLQVMQALSFSVSGKSSLKTLGTVEVLEKPSVLHGNMLYCGLYINELLSRTLPDNEVFSKVFDEYRIILAKIHAVQSAGLDEQACLQRVQPILRNFEFTLLEELGYLPDLSLDADTEQLLSPHTYYQFSSECGCVQSQHTGQGMLGEDILNVYHRVWNDNSIKAAKRIVRLAFYPLLGTKPLKSRELFSLSLVK